MASLRLPKHAGRAGHPQAPRQGAPELPKLAGRTHPGSPSSQAGRTHVPQACRKGIVSPSSQAACIWVPQACRKRQGVSRHTGRASLSSLSPHAGCPRAPRVCKRGAPQLPELMGRVPPAPQAHEKGAPQLPEPMGKVFMGTVSPELMGTGCPQALQAPNQGAPQLPELTGRVSPISPTSWAGCTPSGTSWAGCPQAPRGPLRAAPPPQPVRPRVPHGGPQPRRSQTGGRVGVGVRV